MFLLNFTHIQSLIFIHTYSPSSFL